MGSKRKRKAQPKAVSGRSPMLARARRWWGFSKRRYVRPRLDATKMTDCSGWTVRRSVLRNSSSLIVLLLARYTEA